jgi:hypothetical protein
MPMPPASAVSAVSASGSAMRRSAPSRGGLVAERIRSTELG